MISGSSWMGRRRRYRVSLLLLSSCVVLLLGATVACRPPAERTTADERQVDVRVLETPARIGPTVLEIEVRHRGETADGATVRVTGDMTHAGMVPVVSEALPAGAGIYRTETFAFTMAGDWIITIDVRYPDGAERQVVVPVAVRR